MGWAFFFMTTEALIGAGIVLLRMVATNPAVARAYWMAGHLTNTFVLLLALTVAAWASSRPESPTLRLRGKVAMHLGIAHLAILLVGVTGAVAALGDTLFPVSSVLEGLERDFLRTAHLFERRRVWHPLFALMTSAYLVALSIWVSRNSTGSARDLAGALGMLTALQIMVGFANVWLLAPVWMQLVHLFVADATWITLVLLGLSLTARTASPSG